MLEAALGGVALVALAVVVVWLLSGPDDPVVEEDELPRLVAGNWPRVEEELREGD